MPVGGPAQEISFLLQSNDRPEYFCLNDVSHREESEDSDDSSASELDQVPLSEVIEDIESIINQLVRNSIAIRPAGTQADM
ncbi:serine/threonine protein kinase [Penicillium herquei]|nr:serine/threonine protein kinase [Penicillium herquei]